MFPHPFGYWPIGKPSLGTRLLEEAMRDHPFSICVGMLRKPLNTFLMDAQRLTTSRAS
jgi:hypothetical protein